MRYLCLSILCLLAVLVTNNVTADESDIDIMSFNIRYGTAEDGPDHWNLRKSLVFEVLRNRKPDIIGLQEAHRFQIDEIRSEFPGYAEIGEGHAGGDEGEFSAILYRQERFAADKSGTFWLSETPDIPSKHWRSDRERVCSWVRLVDATSMQGFHVFNTHLDWYSLPARERSVRMIVERILDREDPGPFILMGDFNARESNPSIRYLKGETVGKPIWPPLMSDKLKYLHSTFLYLNRLFRNEVGPLSLLDSFRVIHPDEQQVLTIHYFKGGLKGRKVDYIFVPGGTRVIDADIVRTETEGRYPSDHYPVTARIKFESHSQ